MEFNNIYNIDCLEGLKQLENDSIDCIITSPPYYKGLSYESNFNSYLQYISFMKKVIKESFRILKNEKYMFLNFANDKTNTIKSYEILFLLIKYFKLHDTIIWYRYNSQPVNTDRQLTPQYEFIFMLVKNPTNYHLNKEILKKELPNIFDTENVGNVWKIPFNSNKSFSMKKQNEDASNGLWGHSGFPELIPKACLLLTTKENEIIFDPFSGSGTTCAVAKEKKRIYLGFEINKNYYDYSIKRLNNITKEIF